MATVGLRNFYVAELTAETAMSATYGPGRKLAPAIEASITPNIESATLQGDDRAVEVAESLGSIEVEINVTDLSPDDYAFLLGKTKNGDGVVEDHIDDGDYVVIEETPEVNNGDIVVALLDNGLATLKRFYKEVTRIRLEPANSSMSPIYATNVQIQGRVVGLIRKFRYQNF